MNVLHRIFLRAVETRNIARNHARYQRKKRSSSVGGDGRVIDGASGARISGRAKNDAIVDVLSRAGWRMQRLPLGILADQLHRHLLKTQPVLICPS
jgi:hypothetical protein